MSMYFEKNSFIVRTIPSLQSYVSLGYTYVSIYEEVEYTWGNHMFSILHLTFTFLFCETYEELLKSDYIIGTHNLTALISSYLCSVSFFLLFVWDVWMPLLLTFDLKIKNY